jgi:hypothetical protein
MLINYCIDEVGDSVVVVTCRARYVRILCRTPQTFMSHQRPERFREAS